MLVLIRIGTSMASPYKSLLIFENISSDISYTKYSADLNLGKGLWIFTSFHFPDSGLYLLNGFDFYFDRFWKAWHWKPAIWKLFNIVVTFVFQDVSEVFNLSNSFLNWSTISNGQTILGDLGVSLRVSPYPNRLLRVSHDMHKQASCEIEQIKVKSFVTCKIPGQRKCLSCKWISYWNVNPRYSR